MCKKLEKDVNRANNLYKSICEKLYQLKIIDDSYTMGEFEVMRHQYQQALCQLVEVANDRDISILYNWPLIQESLLEWSRYHQDFEELFHIARGGFGNVFRAKHRLDKVEYAIKKICIKSSDIKSVFNHLSEVKTFASLNHPNIVSYKAAWLEPLIESPNLKNIEDKCENRINYSSNESSEIDSSYLSYNSKSNNSDSICFEDKNTSLKKPVSNIIDCKAVCKVKNSLENSQIITAHANLKWAVLFIQMELCQKTLKCWLEERNSLMSEFKISNMPENFSNEFFNLDILNSDSFEERIDQIKHSHVPTAFEIITQLTQAIEYIHQKGIIHHDVKPSNIFINMETKKINVQLADFGLACPLQRCHKGSAIGTQLYAAPEQLNGECDSKVFIIDTS